MKGYIVNIEEETLNNEDYRRVLYTANHCQLVLMKIPSGEEIGEETHHLDQFIRIESGSATVSLDDEEYVVQADYAIIIPAGVRHNVKNKGTESLKLYTLYAPPEHKDGIVVHAKADAVEEHFDGKTTE